MWCTDDRSRQVTSGGMMGRWMGKDHVMRIETISVAGRRRIHGTMLCGLGPTRAGSAWAGGREADQCARCRGSLQKLLDRGEAEA